MNQISSVCHSGSILLSPHFFRLPSRFISNWNGIKKSSIESMSQCDKNERNHNIRHGNTAIYSFIYILKRFDYVSICPMGESRASLRGKTKKKNKTKQKKWHELSYQISLQARKRSAELITSDIYSTIRAKIERGKIQRPPKWTIDRSVIDTCCTRIANV